MPPKQFFTHKGKGKASSSTPSTVAPRYATHPWPRPENTPFDLGIKELPPITPDAWDTRDAYYYNQLLGLKIEPTRYMCETTLQQLGLQDQVRQILGHAHCMSFALEEDVLYPDLVRQCLATATLTYKDPEAPSFSEATFSFFAGGTKYTMTMYDFCVLYGFRETVTTLEFPKKFTQSKYFWSLIASGPYSSNSASQNRLRHPALRICTRILSNMLFARAAGNKVHIDELLLLFMGCGPIVGEGNAEQYEVYRANLGVRFAEVICSIKDSSTGTNGARTERIGSLLTPLFRHHRVNLADFSCVAEILRIDMPHLVASKILREPSTYRFMDASGEARFVDLPNPTITELYTLDDLAFHPPPQYLVANPSRSSSARPSTSRRSTSRDPTTPIPPLALPFHAAETQGEFDLPPISDDAEPAEYRRWMVESTKKNNSLMQRIMQTLSKGCCHTAAARDAQPVPSNSTSGSGQPLRRKKRRTHDEDDDTASTR